MIFFTPSVKSLKNIFSSLENSSNQIENGKKFFGRVYTKFENFLPNFPAYKTIFNKIAVVASVALFIGGGIFALKALHNRCKLWAAPGLLLIATGLGMFRLFNHLAQAQLKETK